MLIWKLSSACTQQGRGREKNGDERRKKGVRERERWMRTKKDRWERERKRDGRTLKSI